MGKSPALGQRVNRKNVLSCLTEEEAAKSNFQRGAKPKRKKKRGGEGTNAKGKGGHPESPGTEFVK